MPERSRKRKNNKNKRKNNKNKSETPNQTSSANDVQTNIDSINEEVGQYIVTEGTSDIDRTLQDKLSSDQIVHKNLVNNNNLNGIENTLIASCSVPIDLSLTENEVRVDSNLKNDGKEESKDEHKYESQNEFENQNELSNINENYDSNISDINDKPKTDEQSGENECEINLVTKHNESLNEYLVESPDQKSIKKSKLSSNGKSKSVDNDDSPTIIEVTEEETHTDDDPNLSIKESNTVIITDADSDIEWHKTDELDDTNTILTNDIKVSSVSTLPLNIAQCHQTNTHITDDEDSLRTFLHSLNLATNPEDANTLEIKAEIEHIINREIKHRLRKRGLADDFLFKTGPSRSLTVIDEEGSSESSITSRRQSYLSDKVSDNEDLDDVFINEVSQLRKVAKERHGQIKPAHIHTSKAIPQECLRVDAKIKEPEITEARGGWSMKTTEKLTGAELVYLTDSSSSTSSLYDQSDDKDNEDDNDLSVRIITPTIEVTDTEHFLTNTHISKNYGQNIDENSSDSSTIQSNHKVNNESVDHKYDDPHEIVIESTDNIETNLYVKEIPEDAKLKKELNANDEIEKSPKIVDKYDLEMKVIKCELNDAINNLIKEVTSDTESMPAEELLQRQDSSSSLGSSQCTARYNPNHSSLNDVADIINDNHNEIFSHSNHVKEIYAHIEKNSPEVKNYSHLNSTKQPDSLKQVCLHKISSLPYGNKIIEELANVSERLQNMSLQSTVYTEESKNNFDERRPVQSKHEKSKLTDNLKGHIIPPPLQPRTSSFKIAKDEHKQELLSTSEPIYRCLSPSKKMLMEKTKTIITPNKNHPLLKHSDFDQNKSTSIHKNYNEQKENYRLKSDTGSRLLSLIRDTSLKSNSNSTLYKSNKNENLERISKINFSEPFRSKYSQTNKTGLSQFDSYNNYLTENFKPIPPPKFRSFSSSFYESDDSSDLTEYKLRKVHNERRYFHYSTGNLSKDIENDVSSIQNLHRNCMIKRDNMDETRPRRPSLPKDLCEQQMEYIRQKEKEVDAEIRRLERENEASKNKKGPRAPMISEESFERRMLSSAYQKPVIKDVHSCGKEKKQISSIFSSSEEELHREKMYSEYISQMAEREKRKEHKVIKITKRPPIENTNIISKSMTALDSVDNKVNNPIESEFITKAKERWNKLGIKDPETEDERDKDCDVYREPKIIEHKIKVIDSGEEKDVKNLPNHLQEFVNFTVKDTEKTSSPETVMIAPTFKARSASPVVWRPGAPPAPVRSESSSHGAPPPPPPPVWSPSNASSPQPQRKTFRPVHFEESPPPRRKASADQNGCTSGSESEGRLKTSHSAPATGLNSLGLSTSSRLPRAQNPTVTLLQKAREGLLSQTSNYMQQERDARLPRDRPSPPKGDPVYALRKEYAASEGEADRRYERDTRKMSDAHKKVDGIGPTTKDGMPVTLRSEVKDPSKWYKKMYDTIHKNKYDDDYVTIRYKNRRGETLSRPGSNRSQHAYFDPRSGYLSEPEGGLLPSWSDYDSDVSGPRRRTASVQEERRHAESPYPPNKFSTLASARASQEVYRGQPGRIENYVPGRSSVMDKEAKQWWDEVMDIFDGQNRSNSTLSQASPKEKKDITSAILSKSNMARALKESGYESDSTLVFRRREETDGPLSPAERRAAYRDLQAGGEPPLRGFRSPAPPRQESPNRRYVESDVNIHYRCPVRHDPLPLVPERELARQQAEHMKTLYREQKRNKYLQELQDAQNRRHQDNFMPSQKLVIPPNRYDEAEKTVARALYTFNGQTARELSFRKGDFINVRKQIDANWYEGEVHGRIGLFPYNYAELLKSDDLRSPKKPTVIEGRAKAKFDFTAQTNLELPLKKGEIVILTRRIDQNWWEGRSSSKTGIFPDSYVTVLQEPSQSKPETQPILNTDKPVASPAAHGLLNGSDKRSMGTHSYTPQQNSAALANAPPATQPLTGYTKPQRTLTPSDRGYGPPTGPGVDLNNTEPLYVDTNAESIPYRAMYKYRPQNPDELELNEGDTVYVLEKCDDGWYVGSSQRTGRFGTFPGNYVERI